MTYTILERSENYYFAGITAFRYPQTKYENYESGRIMRVKTIIKTGETIIREQLIQNSKELSSEEIIKRVIDTVQEFKDPSIHLDDLTLIVVKCLEPPLK